MKRTVLAMAVATLATTALPAAADQAQLKMRAITHTTYAGTFAAAAGNSGTRRIVQNSSPAMVVAPASSAGLVITPTFDSSITSQPAATAAAIENAINAAISVFQARFSDPITVSIYFRYATTRANGSTPLSNGTLAQSESGEYLLAWNTYLSLLVADAHTANDALANAHLPGVAATTNITPTSANARALGQTSFTGLVLSNGSCCSPGNYDGVVTLNSNQPFQFTRPTSTGNYDAQRAIEHEVDEVLGLGSYNFSPDGLTASHEADYRPLDLFSFSGVGTPSVLTTGSRYLSIDGGVTNIVGLNQDPGGDFGDWLSGTCPQSTPFVQNAFGCDGQSSDVAATSPEGINLDVIGYDLVTTSALAAPTGVDAHATTNTNIHVSWNAVTGATDYQVLESTNGTTFNAIATTSSLSIDRTVTAGNAYLYRVHARDAGANNGADSVSDLAAAVAFTNTITAGSTAIKAVDFTELRTAVNGIERLAGITNTAYTDPTLGSTVTIKKAHIDEPLMRLNAALTQLRADGSSNLASLSLSGGAITAQVTPIRASDINDLRAGVR